MYRYNFPNRKLKRQESAKARLAISEKLTVEQRLAKATAGSREHMRLLVKSQKA